MKNKDYLLFDLDGTLVDSIPGIARGLNLALESLGCPEHSVEAIRGMVGRGARELCVAALRGYFNGPVPESAFEALHAGFMREYRHTWENGTVPYAGIRDMLLQLAEEGHPLGVLSNKPHDRASGASRLSGCAFPDCNGFFRAFSPQAGAGFPAVHRP